MEDFLDSLWFGTVGVVHHIVNFLEGIFTPLNSLGPAVAIFVIALITVVIAKFLTKTITTKRYMELKKEFSYWFNLRQEALECEDRDKGKLLAKNIDGARLNRVYYDYFLEGFLLSLVTKYLPILSALAYVNEAYKPGNMVKLFGRDYVFKLGYPGGEAIIIGAVFWFVIAVVLIYLGWAISRKLYKKYSTAPVPSSVPHAK